MSNLFSGSFRALRLIFICHKTKTASEFLVLLVNTYTLSQGRRKGMDAIPSGIFFPFLSFFLSFFFLNGLIQNLTSPDGVASEFETMYRTPTSK